MADITVRAPNGDIVEVPQAEYEKALRAGYTNVSQEEADAARQEYIAVDPVGAARAGFLRPPSDALPLALAERAAWWSRPTTVEEIARDRMVRDDYATAGAFAELSGYAPFVVLGLWCAWRAFWLIVRLIVRETRSAFKG